MPWSMTITLAPWMFHVSVDDPPGLIVLGEAVKALITGGGVPSAIVLVVIVALAVFKPKLLRAVSV